MKRRWIGLIILLAVGMSIIGVSKQQRPVQSEDESITLRVVLWDYDVVIYDRELIENFEKDHPDIKIDVISYPPTYYNSSLTALLDSGETVDVIYVNQLDQLSQITDRNLAMPLDSYIRRDGVPTEHYPGLDVLRGRDGELLALPYRRDKFLLYYNKDLLDMAGVEYPTDTMSWIDFMQYTGEVSENLWSGQFAACFLLNETQILQYMRDRSWSGSKENIQLLQDGMELLRTMKRKKYILPFSVCESYCASQRMFETGNYGLFVHGTWYLNYLQNDRNRFHFAWGVAEKPNWRTDQPYNAMMLTPICINRNTQHPEAAWTFVQYLCGKQGAATLAENLVLPAYEDESIRDILTRKLTEYGIDSALVLDGYDAPETALTPEQSRYMKQIYQYYREALLELCTPQQAMEKIQQLYYPTASVE